MQKRSYHISSADDAQIDRFRWLTTFNDMITLLMVFFVLLFSMGSLDVRRFKNFQNALQSAMGVLDSGQQAPVGIIADEKSQSAATKTADDANAADSSQFEQLQQTQGLEAEYTPKGIQLILDDNLLFDSGSASLTRQGALLLDNVAHIIRPLNRYIRVEGHTDNIPISTQRYPSNWELSTARAIQVVKHLNTNGGIAHRRLSAAGYGASKPRASNSTESNRSKNRRVEIILQQQVAP